MHAHMGEFQYRYEHDKSDQMEMLEMKNEIYIKIHWVRLFDIKS